jgi:hypothetical protein
VLYNPASNSASDSASNSANPSANPTIVLSQAENDYLYDLSQALQSVEQRRIRNAEKLAIGRQIAGWLQAGADYWKVRAQFDQTYGNAITGDYGHNRDVYIKFATERLAPAFIATLAPPPPEPQVIVQTRTEYVEVPSQPQVIETVVEKVIPDPYPVPVPVYPPYPPRPQPQPQPDRPERPHDPDQPNQPHPPLVEHPSPDPDWPADPPIAEIPEPAPQPVPPPPSLEQPQPNQPEQPAQQPDIPTVNLGAGDWGAPSEESSEPVL